MMSTWAPEIARRAGLALLMLTASAGVGLAQDSARGSGQTVPSHTAIQQMNSDAPGQAEATDAAQVSARPTPPLFADPFRARDSSVAGSAHSPAGPVPYNQLTNEAATAEVGVVVPTEGPNIGPSPSAAARALGRVTRVSTPDGPDRCDPQSLRAAAVKCDRVIEARANEFSAPDPQPLSAEQRLLATQRELRPASVDVGTAARRLASGQIDDSDAALAIASVTLQQTSRLREDESPAADTSTLDAIVAGITSLVSGAPPNP